MGVYYAKLLNMNYMVLKGMSIYVRSAMSFLGYKVIPVFCNIFLCCGYSETVITLISVNNLNWKTDYINFSIHMD